MPIPVGSNPVRPRTVVVMGVRVVSRDMPPEPPSSRLQKAMFVCLYLAGWAITIWTGRLGLEYVTMLLFLAAFVIGLMRYWAYLIRARLSRRSGGG